MGDINFIHHLNRDHVRFDFDGDKVAVYGMSGVPERKSKDILEQWAPNPDQNIYNILMLHQNLREYIDDPINTPLELDDLPEGFDTYVSGHMHRNDEKEIKGANFIIPGSLIYTRTNTDPAPKGFYQIDTDEDECTFIEVETPREYFYREIEVEDKTSDQIEESVETVIEDILSEQFDKIPIIRVDISGKLMRGITKSDFNVNKIKRKHNFEAIIKFNTKVIDKNYTAKKEKIERIKENKLSIKELGMKILDEQIEDMDIDIEMGEMFEELTEDKVDQIFERIKTNNLSDINGQDKD